MKIHISGTDKLQITDDEGNVLSDNLAIRRLEIIMEPRERPLAIIECIVDEAFVNLNPKDVKAHLVKFGVEVTEE